jgi:hypothetical protein
MGSVLAYTPTSEDEKLLESVEKQINTLAEQDPEMLAEIAAKIEVLTTTIPEDSRAGYVLGMLYVQISLALGDSDVESLIDALFSEGDEDDDMDYDDQDEDDQNEDEEEYEYDYDYDDEAEYEEYIMNVYGEDADRDMIEMIYDEYEDLIENMFTALEEKIEMEENVTASKDQLVETIEMMFSDLSPYATPE